MKTILHGMGAALILGVALDVQAQAVPPLINYQGQLLAANGNPLATGDYEMEIQLFPVESSGVAVWGPQVFNGESGTGMRPKVSAVDGRFNLVLGPEDTAGRDLAEVVATSPALFLEIKVGTGSPIAPRQQLLTAPYALSAAEAANVAGHNWSALFANGDPVNGNMGIGVAPSEIKADVNGRMRVRQANHGSAGIWFNQNSGGDRAFVGMLDSDKVGFYTAVGAGWAFTVDVNTGYSSALGLELGPARLTGSTSFFGPGLFFRSFYVSGVDNSYFEGDVWANSVKLTSDERLKENVETIDDPIAKLEGIRGVSFNFKEDTSRTHLNSRERRIGVLAQDVEKVLPEAVAASPDGYLAVNYEGLVPVLIEAVKAQQRQIESLQKEIEALKGDRF